MIKDQVIEARLTEYFPGEASLIDPSARPFGRGGWKDVFTKPRAKWKDAALELWEPFSDVLPTFTEVHSKYLVDAVPARCEGIGAVIYCYEVGGDLWLYRGGLPLTREGELEFLQNFPPMFLEFYSSLHDGFAFIPGNSAGPLPNGEMFELDEVEWDWLAEADDPDQYEPLDRKQAIFWNGDAGYIALEAR